MIVLNKPSYYVYIGAVGWSGASGMADLYPEDLPTDWQLSFYNTQFRCVYIPESTWVDISDEDAASWLRDTQESFRFILESPAEPTLQTIQLASRFGERAVLENEVYLQWLDEATELRDLAKTMQSAVDAGQAVYLVSREGNLTLLRQVNELIEVMGV